MVGIEIVRELAFTSTIGVTVMIIMTNKVLLPILLVHEVRPRPQKKLKGNETAGAWLWEKIGQI